MRLIFEAISRSSPGSFVAGLNGEYAIDENTGCYQMVPRPGGWTGASLQHCCNQVSRLKVPVQLASSACTPEPPRAGVVVSLFRSTTIKAIVSVFDSAMSGHKATLESDCG